jgi:hypothetical protein
MMTVEYGGIKSSTKMETESLETGRVSGFDMAPSVKGQDVT